MHSDGAARAAGRNQLRTGPRGGGRQVPKMIDHVFEADRAYLSAIGGRVLGSATMTDLRDAFDGALAARAAGEPAPPRRSTKPLWTPRYAIRRSAWHALDHAWEIEDRS